MPTIILPVVDTDSIGWTFNVPTDALANVLVRASVTTTSTLGGGVQLMGDVTTPGTTKYYGTDGGGTKGFFAFPGVTAAVTTLHVSGNPGLQGDVTLVQGVGVTLSQSGQNITVANNGVTGIHVSGSSILGGDVTLIQGSNITLTQSGQNITIAASGGGGTDTRRIPLEIRSPQTASNPGNSFFNIQALTNQDFGLWEFVKDVEGAIFAVVNVPPEASTPNAKIILIIAANATSGVTVLNLGTKCVADDNESINVSFTNDTAQNITVPGTAYLTKKVTFTAGDLTNAAPNDLIFVKIAHNGTDGNDTLAVDTLLVDAFLEVDVTPT